jgi:outer membrane protein TolC
MTPNPSLPNPGKGLSPLRGTAPFSGFLGLVLATAGGCALTPAEICRNIILPEQRSIEYRDPSQVPSVPVPATQPPRTVSASRPQTPEWQLALDEAIRIALERARVIRVLAGTTAVASGQTIYDAAITNTTIDQAQARFDPVLNDSAVGSRTNTPFAEFDPLDPTHSLITSMPTDAFNNTLGLTKTNVLGGQWGLNWTENPMRIARPGPFPLNPENPTALQLSYTQPLLQGAGFLVNTAPIVIARLNTEQSFFQEKDSVQELVRGVIEAYWTLVLDRLTVWARKIQVEQSRENFERESARLRTGFGDAGTVAQAKLSYSQFQASLIAAEAAVLAQEGVLRNLLGLPPEDDRRIVPVSVPTNHRLQPDWNDLIRLAEQRRPDIVELKIVTEADQVRLLQARNQTLPQLNAVASYTWNGLSGEMFNEARLSTSAGQYTSWSAGVSFSVPLGFRQGRALVRQQELLIARDQANVEEEVHLALHQLAATIRDLDSAYEQYLAYRGTRAAAEVNLRLQNEKFRTGQGIYLNVLQALNDWGNAVTTEAQQLLTYNIALAALERQTGTILETHGLVFYEESFRAAGPLGIVGHGRLYPFAEVPVGFPQRYPGGNQPAENAFDLENPAPRKQKPPENLPPPAPLNQRP